MISFESVGFVIICFSLALSLFWLGFVLGWFYTPLLPVPPSKVRKRFFDWFLELLGLQRINESKSLSDMVISDKKDELVFPSPPPAPVQELGKGVVLSADYETHKVVEVQKPAQVQAAGSRQAEPRKKPVITRFEED